MENSESDSVISVELQEDHNDEDVVELQTELAVWSTSSMCTRDSLNQLLAILRRNRHPELPKDSRTLLKTPRSATSYSKCGGDFFHLGIESGIKRIFDSIVITNEVTQNVELIVNIDGLPLFKSSSLELWPFLCRFKGLKPFIVSVYCGTKKPNSINEFLKDFLMEYQLLKTEGFLYKTIDTQSL